MGSDELARILPAPIRRALRKEVNFGCPVPRCRSPFLEYHHFDPEWHIEHHRRLEGIIPLCPTHHAQAAAFTVEQLREFKQKAQLRAASGRFEWLRRDLVGIVGGSVYHDTPTLIQIGDSPMIWFNRDEDGYALLNARMLTTEGNEHDRISIIDNDFVVRGTPSDFESPPSGRILRVRYENGDYMRVEFHEFQNLDSSIRKMTSISQAFLRELPDSWPMTFVMITMKVGGTEYYFAPSSTRFPRQNVMRLYSTGCRVGLRIDP